MDMALALLKETPTLASLIKSALLVADFIEHSKGPMPGPEKLALLQKYLRDAIAGLPIGDGAKADLLEAVDVTVPAVIAGAVYASKLGLALQNRAGSDAACLPRLC